MNYFINSIYNAMEIGFNVLIFVIKWRFCTAEIQMRFETT